MLRTLSRIVLYSVLLLAVVAGWGTLTLHRFTTQDKIKPKLEKAFSDFLRRPITIEEVGWQIFPMPAILGYQVQLLDDKNEVMAEDAKVVIEVSLKELGMRKVKLENLIFVQPKGTLRRRADKSIPLASMIKDILTEIRRKRADPNRKPPPFKFRQITIEGGDLTFIDQTVSKNPLKTTLTLDAAGIIEGKPGARSFPFWLKARVNHPEQTGDLEINGTLKKYLDVELVSKKFPVASLSDYTSLVSPWQGTFSAKGTIKKTPTGVQWKARGETKGFRPKKKGPFPKTTLVYALNPNATSSFQISIDSPQTEAVVNLSYPTWGRHFVQGTLNSGRMNIEDVLAWKKEFSALYPPKKRASTERKPTSFDLKAEVQISSATYKTIVLDQLDFQLHKQANGSLTLDPIEARGLKGTLLAKARFVKETSTATVYNVEWDVKNVTIAPLIQAFTDKRILTGTGQTMGRLTGRLGEIKMRKANGNINFELTRGMVWGVPGLIKSFSQLNLTSLLRKQKGDPDAFPYDVAKATVTVVDGTLQIKDTGVFENETLQVGLMGKVNLVQNQVDGTLVFHVLSVAGEFLKRIPGVKTLFYGGKKGLVPLWVTVKGPLKDPSVTPLPVKSISAPFWRTIKNVIRFPFGKVDMNKMEDMN